MQSVSLSFERLLSVVITITCVLITAYAAPQKRAPSRAPQPGTATRPSSATGALKVTTGHPGSVVFINNVRHGVTKENGELDLARVFTGSYPVTVKTTGYVDWHGSAVIAPRASRAVTITQQPT